MQYKKISIILFIVLFLLSRLIGLSCDTVNPDAVNWHYRSEQFVVGLKQLDFTKTYQHYHPGVTLMWIAGPVVELVKQVTGNIYESSTYLNFHLVVKGALILTQLGLILYALFLVTKVSGFTKAYAMIFILSFEPFFVGNSRLFHLDILFTLLTFIGLLTSYLYVKEQKSVYAYLAGLFVGLSFLTKSVGIGELFFVLGFGGTLVYMAHKQNLLKYLTIVVLSTLGTIFILWPVLWIDATNTFTNLYLEAARVGVRNGHDQIFFGTPTDNPGIFFYPLVTLLKMSPLIMFGIVGYLYKLFLIFQKKEQNTIKFATNRKNIGFITYMLVFYGGYFLVMTMAAKKLDRYMLVLYPLLAYLAAYGFIYLYSKVKNKKTYFMSVGGLVFVFLVFPLVSITPYLFTYTNPLFGSTKNANTVIAQKPFGVAMPELKEKLLAKYGEVTFGMFDTKPLKAIYSNSKVRDIRISGASSYDVLVLAINEEMPDDISDQFVQDDTLVINGLDYYTMYVKK